MVPAPTSGNGYVPWPCTWSPVAGVTHRRTDRRRRLRHRRVQRRARPARHRQLHPSHPGAAVSYGSGPWADYMVDVGTEHGQTRPRPWRLALPARRPPRRRPEAAAPGVRQRDRSRRPAPARREHRHGNDDRLDVRRRTVCARPPRSAREQHRSATSMGPVISGSASASSSIASRRRPGRRRTRRRQPGRRRRRLLLRTDRARPRAGRSPAADRAGPGTGDLGRARRDGTGRPSTTGTRRGPCDGPRRRSDAATPRRAGWRTAQAPVGWIARSGSSPPASPAGFPQWIRGRVAPFSPMETDCSYVDLLNNPDVESDPVAIEGLSLDQEQRPNRSPTPCATPAAQRSAPACAWRGGAAGRGGWGITAQAAVRLRHPRGRGAARARAAPRRGRGRVSDAVADGYRASKPSSWPGRVLRSRTGLPSELSGWPRPSSGCAGRARRRARHRRSRVPHGCGVRHRQPVDRPSLPQHPDADQVDACVGEPIPRAARRRWWRPTAPSSTCCATPSSSPPSSR